MRGCLDLSIWVLECCILGCSVSAAWCSYGDGWQPDQAEQHSHKNTCLRTGPQSYCWDLSITALRSTCGQLAASLRSSCLGRLCSQVRLAGCYNVFLTCGWLLFTVTVIRMRRAKVPATHTTHSTPARTELLLTATCKHWALLLVACCSVHNFFTGIP